MLIYSSFNNKFLDHTYLFRLNSICSNFRQMLIQTPRPRVMSLIIFVNVLEVVAKTDIEAAA